MMPRMMRCLIWRWMRFLNLDKLDAEEALIGRVTSSLKLAL